MSCTFTYTSLNRKLRKKLTARSETRYAWNRAKLSVGISSRIKSLRLRRGWSQKKLAEIAGMKQSRISAMEEPGRVNFNLDTLVRLSAAFGISLCVDFVGFQQLLNWENNYSQDEYEVRP